MAIILKSQQEIEVLYDGGQRLAQVLHKLSLLARPGVSTYDIDVAAREYVREQGGTPSFLGYHDFPAAVCISVNEAIVHGLPRKEDILQDGDIVGIDIGMWYGGLCNDTALTVAVGRPSEKVQQLLQVTQESLYLGLAQCVDGKRVGDVGAVISGHIEPHGYGIVRDLVGHGVGKKVHEEPQVPNIGTAGEGVVLKNGMVLAIEPMVNLGGDDVMLHEDDWTYVTKDGTYSAHFEHTVAITPSGPRVLTRRAGERIPHTR